MNTVTGMGFSSVRITMPFAMPPMFRRKPNHALRDWLECFQSVLSGKYGKRTLGIPDKNTGRGGGAWGKGYRLYMQGPGKPGTPSQGYQLPLTPAQLYRAGIEATNAHCRKTYGRTFDRLSEQQREEVLVGLSTAKITFDSGLPVRVFWTTVYQTVIEGMFSDPIYGGNRNKAGWKMIGFSGAVAVARE